MSNTFGKLFKVTTWGESHGPSIGAVIDGCPSGLYLTPEDIQCELNRRKPGQSSITTQRQETDQVQILSGIHQNLTLGSPISLLIHNKDSNPNDYTPLQNKFRPSHADFTYQMKYGIPTPSGGGRSSARETAARVAAGAIAKKILYETNQIEIRAYVETLHTLTTPPLPHFPTLNEIDHSPIRCPHPETAKKMIALIEQTKTEGDSLGGIILCRIRNTPPGLGEPIFDRLEANLAKAMLSIPATKGFEIGSGFSATLMKGSQHNDPFIKKEGKIATLTNHSGGIQGGITNGEEIFFRVAFKPTSTIMKTQNTINSQGQETTIPPTGRHDPCILPRAVPIIEAMAALVLVDHWLIHKAYQPSQINITLNSN